LKGVQKNLSTTAYNSEFSMREHYGNGIYVTIAVTGRNGTLSP